MDNVHERVWERSRRPQPLPVWTPRATYALLATMGIVYVLQNIIPDGRIWLVWIDWLERPWSPITSTFAHGDLFHILINGLMLYFFGPVLERFIGARDLVILFLVSGVATGIAQVEMSALWGDSRPALGASGAIMMIFGTLTILMPREKILIWGIVPVPFWGAAVGYAVLDLLGAFNPNDGIGNIAHLVGMAMGVLYGIALKQRSRARGRVHAGL